jgi:hypothetical protein
MSLAGQEEGRYNNILPAIDQLINSSTTLEQQTPAQYYEPLRKVAEAYSQQIQAGTHNTNNFYDLLNQHLGDFSNSGAYSYYSEYYSQLGSGFDSFFALLLSNNMSNLFISPKLHIGVFQRSELSVIVYGRNVQVTEPTPEPTDEPDPNEDDLEPEEEATEEE